MFELKKVKLRNSDVTNSYMFKIYEMVIKYNIKSF